MQLSRYTQNCKLLKRQPILITWNLYKSSYEYDFLEEFVTKIDRNQANKIKKKQETHRRKLNNLMLMKPKEKKGKVKPVENYIKNLSSVSSSEEELEVLNLGLNHVPKKPSINIEKTIVEVETALKWLPPHEKDSVRKDLCPILREMCEKRTSNCKEIEVIKKLKEKDVFFMKADKGNSMVIVDKSEYEKSVMDIVTGENFELLKSKNPLTAMIREVNSVLKDCELILGVKKFRLVNSNPRIPTLYVLYKTHKEGRRPIISCVNCPTSKIAKYLVSEFNKLVPPNGFYIKNSLDLLMKLQKLNWVRMKFCYLLT